MLSSLHGWIRMASVMLWECRLTVLEAVDVKREIIDFITRRMIFFSDYGFDVYEVTLEMLLNGSVCYTCS